MVALEEASCSSEVMSDTACTSSLAATRGKMERAEEEWEATTWVKGLESERTFCKRGDTSSGIACAYCGEAECQTAFKPFNLSSVSIHLVHYGEYILLRLLNDLGDLFGTSEHKSGHLPAQLARCR